MSMKNNADALIFRIRIFVFEQKQISLMAEEKSPARNSLRLFATSCSEVRSSVKNLLHLKIFHTAFCAAGVTK